MDLLQHFRRLFAYDEWANREVLAALRANPNPRSVQLLSHIFAAQRVWVERLLQVKQSLPVWPDLTLDQCEAQAADLANLWKNYFERMDPGGATAIISYKNTKGEAFTSRVDDILMHVIMHSAYHRGQIASAARAAGSTPASTDFILAIRQGFIE